MEQISDNSLQEKILRIFEGKVVRKDLTSQVKGNAVVPSYVLEYLLGSIVPLTMKRSSTAVLKRSKRSSGTTLYRSQSLNPLKH